MSSTAPTPEFVELKGRLKKTWEAGDFSQVAKHTAKGAEQFVDRIGIQSGMTVLDVACGSGNLAVNAARNGAEVTGLDLAENLVEAAKLRAKDLGLDIKFEQGDAEALPYEDNTFDVVMTMFGAMFAPRPEIVADELLRVCKPGGRVAMANWTPDGFAGKVFALAGKYLPPPNMPAPVLWGVPEIVRERFGNRVSDVKTTIRTIEMTYEMPPNEVVQFFRKYFGPTVMTFAAVPEDRHEELTRDMEELWAGNNESKDGSTLIFGEYLEVVVVKG